MIKSPGKWSKKMSLSRIMRSMKQERVALTMKELHRVKVMERLCRGDLSNQEAAGELGMNRT